MSKAAFRYLMTILCILLWGVENSCFVFSIGKFYVLSQNRLCLQICILGVQKPTLKQTGGGMFGHSRTLRM